MKKSILVMLALASAVVVVLVIQSNRGKDLKDSEISVGPLVPALKAGKEEGIKLVYANHVSFPPGFLESLPAQFVSYYFKDGSFWIHLPAGIVVHDARLDRNFFYRPFNRPQLLQLESEMSGDSVSFKDLKSANAVCKVGSQSLPCELWSENIIPDRGVPTRRDVHYLKFSEILKPIGEYQKAVAALQKFFGKERMESSLIHQQVHSTIFLGGDGKAASQFELILAEPFGNLATPGESLAVGPSLPRCKLQADYSCE